MSEHGRSLTGWEKCLLGAGAGAAIATFIGIPLFWDEVTNILTVSFAVLGAGIGFAVGAAVIRPWRSDS